MCAAGGVHRCAVRGEPSSQPRTDEPGSSRLRGRTLERQDTPRPASPTWRSVDYGRPSCGPPPARQPAALSPALRTPRLSRDRRRHARALRGRPRPPRRPSESVEAHDCGVAFTFLHDEGDDASPSADGDGEAGSASVRTSEGRRCRVLRLPAWADGRRSERNRAAPDPPLHMSGGIGVALA